VRKRRIKLVFEADNTDERAGVDLQAVADGRPTAERLLAGRDFLAHLLARTPDDDRLLLLCRAVEGLSMLQLAEMTGLKESTVKVRLFRARRRLAELAAALSCLPGPTRTGGKEAARFAAS
jgi:RNA polymerase sigma-70 factor (ECF subfamily)